MTHRSPIWQRSLHQSLAVFFLTLLITPAFAGGVVVDPNSIEFAVNPQGISPGAQVSVSFRAREYTYGSLEFSYLLAAIVPVVGAKLPSRQELEAATVLGTCLTAPNDPRALDALAQPFRFVFKAPDKPGPYRIVLGQVPMFSTTPLHGSAAPKSLFVPSIATRRQLIAEGGAYLQVVSQFNVVESAAKVVAAPKVYLRVDDKLPQDARLVGGVQDQPLTFSWRIGDEFKGDKSKVVFRYQLSPADDDWGAWGPATESSYTFVQKGVFSFRVQARYGEGANAVISQPASFQGTMPRDLIARPTKEALTKSPVGVVPILQPPIAFDTVYAKSRALLIGMWEFDDYRNFQRFDGAKISADLVALEQALRINGFDQVTVLKRARITKEEIEAAMADLVDAAGKDDRIFVYFSTHGFADEIVSSEGYLATSDCKMAQPTVRCLRLNDLQARVIDRALDGKHARQMLIAVDSCFAGLGIVRKSSASADLTRLAVPQGAFMLTAGMAAQTAQIDPQLGMSTFTYFLAEGLKGKADILGNNGVITLTELFLYVQYEVARRTDSQQIPMLGRMKGDGEMLFRPVAATTPPAK